MTAILPLFSRDRTISVLDSLTMYLNSRPQEPESPPAIGCCIKKMGNSFPKS